MFPVYPYGSVMSKTEVQKDRNPEWVRAGATLRAFREMRGLKVGELANAVLISGPYLYNIENGNKPITPRLAARFAEVLRVRQITLLDPVAFPDAA